MKVDWHRIRNPFLIASIMLLLFLLCRQSAALQSRTFRGRPIALQHCLFSTQPTVFPQDQQMPTLAASRLGLNPAINRFHAPIVHHEHYSFQDWPETHTFPMDKFARLAHALTTTHSKTRSSSNLPRPLVRDYSDFFRPLDFDNNDVPLEWLATPRRAQSAVPLYVAF